MKEEDWPYLLYNVITSGDLARMSGGAFKVYATILMNGDFEGKPEAKRCTQPLISRCTGLIEPGEFCAAITELIKLGHIRIVQEGDVYHYALVDRSRDVENFKRIVGTLDEAEAKSATLH